MIRLIGVLLVVATGLTACRPFTSEATADLPGQISVTMSVRPMAGWHSDWHRTLTIATPMARPPAAFRRHGLVARQ